MIRLVLVRLEFSKTRTLGRLEIYKDLLHIGSYVTLELPWKENERRISCIPVGTYPIRAESHNTKGKVYRVLNVPGRDGILIHKGNTPVDTLGCILVGLRHEDVNKDGEMDVAASTAAMDLIWQMVPDTAQLVVA